MLIPTSAEIAGELFIGMGIAERLTMRTSAWFLIMCALIAAVSIYDTALVILFRDHILQLERNPIGGVAVESRRR